MKKEDKRKEKQTHDTLAGRSIEEVEPLPDEVDALKNVGSEYVEFRVDEYA